MDESQPVERGPARVRATVADSLEELLVQTGRGDKAAFERLYDRATPLIYGVALRVICDPAQAEEVAQEVLLEIWRTATRFDEGRGSAMAWMTAIGHRRAVDRVRSAQALSDRERKAGQLAAASRDYDMVVETVQDRMDRERVRRCMDRLTELQRQAVTMAYYGGYSYPEVAKLLTTSLSTIKTRMRDGMIRLRDCLGVEA